MAEQKNKQKKARPPKIRQYTAADLSFDFGANVKSKSKSGGKRRGNASFGSVQ